MEAVRTRPPVVSLSSACGALGVSRATLYRRGRGPKVAICRVSHRKLSDSERALVLATVNEERFMDMAPAEIHAQMLREGVYRCSLRTMHRILASNRQQLARRNQRRHPAFVVPRLVARAPNRVWSWDITRLLGPLQWQYFYLYVLLDIFSRFVVGWMVSTRECAELAKRLVATAIEKQGVSAGQLTIHADRGAPMTSKALSQTLVELDVTRSHSRPRVSDDNPFSEAQFKTLKYRPDFPGRFGSVQHARNHVRRFFPWYNYEHYHSALGYLTPADVHYGHVAERLAEKALVLEQAWLAHPERFPHGKPVPSAPPIEVWINQPSDRTLPGEPPGTEEVVDERMRPSRGKLIVSRAEDRATRGRDLSAVAVAGPEMGAVSPPPLIHLPNSLGDGTIAPNPRGCGGQSPPRAGRGSSLLVDLHGRSLK